MYRVKDSSARLISISLTDRNIGPAVLHTYLTYLFLPAPCFYLNKQQNHQVSIQYCLSTITPIRTNGILWLYRRYLSRQPVKTTKQVWVFAWEGYLLETTCICITEFRSRPFTCIPAVSVWWTGIDQSHSEQHATLPGGSEEKFQSQRAWILDYV